MLPSSTFAIMARRKEADHRDMLEYADAYMTAWFLMTLKSDQEAQNVFIGENAEGFRNFFYYGKTFGVPLSKEHL